MRIRPKLTYANVMVTLLAFVVLCGGGAYAAGELGRNTVGTKQLKRNAVTGVKVRNGSLKPADFAKGALPAGAPGPAGPAGSSSLGPAYQASGDVNYDVFSSSLYGSTVVTLAVPPGPYLATSAVEVDTVGVGGAVSCRLINGNGGAASTAIQRYQTVRSALGTDSFTLTRLFMVSSGQALNLQCSKSSAESGARVLDANIVAVRVESIGGLGN